MPRPKTSDNSQSARFIAAAEKAEVDKSGRKFARAVKKVVRSTQAKKR